MRAFGTRRVLLLRDPFRARLALGFAPHPGALLRIRRENDELCGGCPTDSVNTLNLEPCAATRGHKKLNLFCNMMSESGIGADLGRGCGMKVM